MPSELRFTRIDELTRPDHRYLGPEDRCHWLREYTFCVGYQHSETNQLILNLKKDMKWRNDPKVWKWKRLAIRAGGPRISRCCAASRVEAEHVRADASLQGQGRPGAR